MRSHFTVLIAALILASSASPLLASDGAFGNAVLPIRVSTDSGPVQATAVVVHRDATAGLVSLDLLTSSTLFETPLGDCEVQPVSVRLPDGRWVSVAPADVHLPHGPMVNIAILRVSTPTDDVVPQVIDYASPTVGSVFVVAGIDAQNRVKTVGEHVRFESTLLVVGDRDLSSLVGCIGSPAMTPQGVVGIVRACNAGRAPTVSLVAIARTFIERALPHAVATTMTETPQFELVDRELRVPLSILPDTPPAGQLTVPIDLGLREALVEATASIAVPRELGLAEIRVLRLDERAVRLAFTIGGGAPLGRPGTPAPYGQAIVTVHLRIAIVATP